MEMHITKIVKMEKTQNNSAKLMEVSATFETFEQGIGAYRRSSTIRGQTPASITA